MHTYMHRPQATLGLGSMLNGRARAPGHALSAQVWRVTQVFLLLVPVPSLAAPFEEPAVVHGLASMYHPGCATSGPRGTELPLLRPPVLPFTISCGPPGQSMLMRASFTGSTVVQSAQPSTGQRAGGVEAWAATRSK